MTLIAVLYVMIINSVAMLLYYLDKKYAVKKKNRISENTLLLCGALGGSIGSAFGMLFFRHKTKHWKFRILVPLFLAVHFAILVLIY